MAGASPTWHTRTAETAIGTPQNTLDAELLDRLSKASPREAEVVTLRFFGGLSEVAIAEVLGVSERTVRNDWSRARERLAGWL